MIIPLERGWIRKWRDYCRVDLRIPFGIASEPALWELFVMWKWRRARRVPACNTLTPFIGVGCPGSQYRGDGLGCATFPRRQSESWVDNTQLRWQKGEGRALNALELRGSLLCHIRVASDVNPVWVDGETKKEDGDEFSSWRSLHRPWESATLEPMLRVWCWCGSRR